MPMKTSSFESAHAKLSEFSAQREWRQFHSPRNLLMAMVGEVGEVAALLQWVDDSGVDEWLDAKPNRDELALELADVLSYLILLADRTGVDLPNALVQKIALNEERYPVEAARGSARKYTDL